MNSRDESFVQDGPQIKNGYGADSFLRTFLESSLPNSLFSKWDVELREFGERCWRDYRSLALEAERDVPVHVPFAPWGERVDELKVSKAWTALEKISAEEALIAMAYEQKEGEHSRLLQFAKLFLFHPHSAFFTCPLAMADGAARVLKPFDKDKVLSEAYQHLTSRDPELFWTSGQWMTEKTGGSDVSDTSTIARKENGETRLYGVKWFSSATTSKIALALARNEGSPEGSKGLTLYLVPTYKPHGSLNNIEILRLKDKLGTRALPTAELHLRGAKAYPVGEVGQGVKTVATMLNITRLYNSICSVGQSAFALDLLADYASRRIVFSKPMKDHPLFQKTWFDLTVKNQIGLLLTFDMVARLGREESGQTKARDSELLRLLTPITKLFTAKAAVEIASEVVEGFGGAGYVEDTGLPKLLRDAQVFPIWEGATHVLSLDFLRAFIKGSGFEILKSEFDEILKSLGPSIAKQDIENLKTSGTKFFTDLDRWQKSGEDEMVGQSKHTAFRVAWFYGQLVFVRWLNNRTAQEASRWTPHLHEMQSHF